jgi:hypothetical protein
MRDFTQHQLRPSRFVVFGDASDLEILLKVNGLKLSGAGWVDGVIWNSHQSHPSLSLRQTHHLCRGEWGVGRYTCAHEVVGGLLHWMSALGFLNWDRLLEYGWGHSINKVQGQ